MGLNQGNNPNPPAGGPSQPGPGGPAGDQPTPTPPTGGPPPPPQGQPSPSPGTPTPPAGQGPTPTPPVSGPGGDTPPGPPPLGEKPPAGPGGQAPGLTEVPGSPKPAGTPPATQPGAPTPPTGQGPTPTPDQGGETPSDEGGTGGTSGTESPSQPSEQKSSDDSGEGSSEPSNPSSSGPGKGEPPTEIASKPKKGEPFDVVILGSGPAGLTAAIYTTRAALSTLIVGGTKWGGQLMLTTEVENYPGFESILGPDLMQKMRKHAERFGAVFVEKDVEEVSFGKKPFTVKADGETYKAQSVIIATGAETKWLGLESEQKYIGKGVSSCAPCDAPFFREKDVVVAGGGDSAMEEALVLTKYAKSVAIAHRRDSFRASQAMQQRVFGNPKIKVFWDTEVKEILGDGKVSGVKFTSKVTGKGEDLKIKAKVNGKQEEVVVDKVGGKVVSNDKEGLTWELSVDGIFVAIGHTPSTKLFEGQVELDEKGYVVVHDHTRTNISGVFVAGDVYDYHYRQAVTAAGFGCMAAMDLERWFEEQKAKEKEEKAS